jgi:DNA-binding NtrC family response regulator
MSQKILVIDEPGFARVCSALLARDGFAAETLAEVDKAPGASGEFDLIITSFPYAARLFTRFADHQTPVLVLADCVSGELLEHMKDIHHIRCLIKPIDFENLGSQVQRMLNGARHGEERGGFEIS